MEVLIKNSQRLFCEITTQGRDDAGAAPGGRSDRPAMLRDENHSGIRRGDICRCFHQGRADFLLRRRISIKTSHPQGFTTELSDKL